MSAPTKPINDFVFGIGLYSADGVNCYGTNTNLEAFTPDEIRGDGEVTFDIESLDLVEGTYKLDVAVHKRDGYPYDYHRLLYTFRVKSRTREVGNLSSTAHLDVFAWHQAFETGGLTCARRSFRWLRPLRSSTIYAKRGERWCLRTVCSIFSIQGTCATSVTLAEKAMR